MIILKNLAYLHLRKVLCLVTLMTISLYAESQSQKLRHFVEDFETGMQHYFNQDLDSAELIGNYAVSYYDSLNRPDKVIIAQLKLTELYQYWRFDDAKAYASLYNALLTLTQNPQLSHSDPYMFVNLGNILVRYDLYNRALLAYREGLKHVVQKQHPDAKVTIYQNIAQIFLTQNAYDSAYFYLGLAQSCISNKLDIIQAQQYYNLSQYFRQLNNQDSTLKYLQLNQALLSKIKPSIINKATKTTAIARQLWYQYSTLAYELEADIEWDRKLRKEAINNYRTAISFAKKAGFMGKLAELINKIGNIYFAEKDYPQAIFCYDSAFEIATQNTKTLQQVTAARMLEKIYDETGKVNMFKLYKSLRIKSEDSLMMQKRRMDAYKDKMKLATASLELSLSNLNRTKSYYEASLKSASRLTQITWMLSGAIVLILLLILRYLYAHKRIASLNQQVAEKELEEVRIKLALKNRELASKAIRLAEVTEYSDALYETLEGLKSSTYNIDSRTTQEITGIIDKISNKSAWKEFENSFEQVHEGFYKNLLNQYPSLTPAEIKICSLLKTNMTTKDIALLTNRSVRTIENTRNSIRRKMHLPTDINLVNHLLKF